MAFKFSALLLCIFMILVFLIQFIFPSFTDALILNADSWSQPWRFVTAIFLHGGLAHLILNLFALALFGSILEKLIGAKSFLLIFLTTGIFANLVSVNFYGASLGASGAIFGVLGVLIIVRPFMPVWAFSLPMPMFLAGIIWAIADILGAYGFFTGNPMNNTGNIAHLSGMFLGIIVGIFVRTKIKRDEKREPFRVEEGLVRAWEDHYMR